MRSAFVLYKYMHDHLRACVHIYSCVCMDHVLVMSQRNVINVILGFRKHTSTPYLHIIYSIYSFIHSFIYLLGTHSDIQVGLICLCVGMCLCNQRYSIIFFFLSDVSTLFHDLISQCIFFTALHLF